MNRRKIEVEPDPDISKLIGNLWQIALNEKVACIVWYRTAVENKGLMKIHQYYTSARMVIL